MKCAVADCVSKQAAKGMCLTHYKRAYSKARRAMNVEALRAADSARYARNRERIRARQRAYYHERGGRERILRYQEENAEAIKEAKRKRRNPIEAVGWARRILDKILTLNCGRRKGRWPTTTCTLESVLQKIEAAHSRGDVSFTNPICAPSPDRINNSLGYSDENVQIVPAWLNYAYHNWNKADVEAAILEWARKRLSERGE